MDLILSLSQCSIQVESTIEDFFSEELRETKAIDRYLHQSVSFLHDFSLRGGKYIRSYLTFLSYQLAGGKVSSNLMKAIASVELHHKHILILDDIADRDESRYGGPTVEYLYRKELKGKSDFEHRSLSFAMMDGVLLGAFSKELLLQSGFPAKTLLTVQHIFNTIMFRDTLAGWQIHGMQCMENLDESSVEEFVKGLKYVTASYTFEGPLLVGLELAENKDNVLQGAIQTYAENVGTAFQIQDDILGLFGDSKKTGKPVGNDVREGKKTLLMQIAYQRATKKDKAFLNATIGLPLNPLKLQRVQEIVTKTGSLAYSQEQGAFFVQKGVQALEKVRDCEQKQLLIKLAHYIISREK